MRAQVAIVGSGAGARAGAGIGAAGMKLGEERNLIYPIKKSSYNLTLSWGMLSDSDLLLFTDFSLFFESLFSSSLSMAFNFDSRKRSKRVNLKALI